MRAPKLAIVVQFLLFLLVLKFLMMSRSKGKPNIIIFLADDMGHNDVPWHNTRIQAPNLRQLSKESILLRNYYTYPLCSPSRASLLTGYYKSNHHLAGLATLDPTGLNTNMALMPQYLKTLGYMTHMVGKWHLGYCHEDYLPTRRGFDSFYGFYNGVTSYHSHLAPVNMGSNNFKYIYDFMDNEDIDLDAKGNYSGTLFFQRARKILFHHANSGKRDKPFFLLLSFQGIHEPIEVPQDREDPMRFSDLPDTTRTAGLKMIFDMDRTIGKIRSLLDDLGAADNTILAFTSDNGAMPCEGGNNYPLRGGRTTLWEGGVRVPALIYFPPHLRYFTGFFEGLFHVSDWLPTLFSAAGGRRSILRDIDGVDQFKALQQSSKRFPRDEVFSISRRHGNGMLRVGDYKLLRGEHCAGLWVREEEMQSVHYQCQFAQELGCDRRKRRRGEVEREMYQLYNVRLDPSEKIDLSSNDTLTEPMIRRFRKLMHQYDQPEKVSDDGAKPYSMVKTGTVQTNWC